MGKTQTIERSKEYPCIALESRSEVKPIVALFLAVRIRILFQGVSLSLDRRLTIAP